MQPTNDELHAELAELQAANVELQRQLTLELSRNEAAEAAGRGPSPLPARRTRRGWGWAVLSAALITTGALLAPVALVSAWAHNELTDTEYFVDTFAPLANEPAVQDFVAAEAVAAIESTIDVDGLIDDLFSGLDELDIPPRAKAALGLLEAPAVSGVKGLIQQAVTGFVRSDAFSQLWEEALTITHTHFVNTATGQTDAAITIGQNQEITLQLGPLIQEVKARLVADGFALADRIPEVSRSITIAESSSVGSYLALYQIVVAVGIWLPWVALFLLAAGVVLARRRAVAMVWASSALLLSMVLAGSGIGIGKNVFAVAVSPSIPHDAAVTLYAGLLGFVANMIVVVGVLAATVLAVSVLAGPWPWAQTLRGYAAAGFAVVRHRAERHGITTGMAGEWIHRWRALLRVVVAVGCSAFLVLARPLSPGMIVWTAVVGVCVVAVLELMSRPPRGEAGAPSLPKEVEIA